MNTIDSRAESPTGGGSAPGLRQHTVKPRQRQEREPDASSVQVEPEAISEEVAEPIWKKLAERLRQHRKAGDHKPSGPAPAPQQQVSHPAQRNTSPSTKPKGQLPLPLTDTAPEAEIPQALRNRYLIDAQQRYYFRDRQQVLAFEDLGARLRTAHDDPDVAASMVSLAESKGWSHLKLRGTTEFKREAWLAAAERGLQVSGHRPSALDKARLAERIMEREQQRQRNANEIAQATPEASASGPPKQARTRRKKADVPPKASVPQPNKQQRDAVNELAKFLRQRGDSEESVAMTVELAADRMARQRTHFGKLVEHGDAPYQHQQDNDKSYFATLQTSNGRQTIWGVDLQRAIDESGANIGDDIVLVHKTRRQVEVSTRERDATGKPTGKRVWLDADRNQWDVVSLDNARDFANQRNATLAPNTQPGEKEKASSERKPTLESPPHHAR